MSKKLRLYSLLSLLGVYGILNLIIFLIIFNGDMNNSAFWISWSFTYPVSYLVSSFIIEFNGRIKKYEDITVIPALLAVLSYDLVSIIASFVMMFIPSISYKIVLIVHVCIVILYAIIEAIIMIGMHYINRNDTAQKAKVFYIRDLENDVNMIKDSTSDEELKKKLTKLAEDIRFSDPMSCESLERAEEELKELVFRLNEHVLNNETEEIEQTLKDISLKLKYRNQKCINLK